MWAQYSSGADWAAERTASGRLSAASIECGRQGRPSPSLPADRLGQAVSVADEPYQRDQVAGFLAVDVVLGVRSASGGEVQREQMRLAVAKHQSNTAGFDILADEVPQLR